MNRWKDLLPQQREVVEKYSQEFITIHQASHIAGVTTRTILEWIRSEKVHGWRQGKVWLVWRPDLL